MKINPNTTLDTTTIYSLFAISCTLEELYSDIYPLLVKKMNLIVKYIIKIIQHETYIKEDSSLHFNISQKQNEQLLNVLENDFESLRMIFSTEQGKFWLEHRNLRLETFEFLHLNNIESTPSDEPIYKTDFEDTMVLIEDKDVDEKEFIQIPGQNFEMSKYVITNKWFNEFIQANGYNEISFWNEMASKVWLMNNKISSLDEKYETMLEKEKSYYKKKYKQNLLKENFNKDLQPVVYVTYHEAKAFCNYLSSIDDKYIYDIPTKEQWDYVARGGEEERLYPWGGNTWNRNYCNNSSNQLHKTSEIGAFPQGNSKYGISDMVGNVWSWTSSLEKK